MEHSKQSQTIQQRQKMYKLWLLEKFIIICQPENSTLNKRNELVSSYAHTETKRYYVTIP